MQSPGAGGAPGGAAARGVFLLGGALSWRAKRQGGAAFKPERTRGTERFVADLGILAALLFALVIIMQGSAALILDECLR
ncbi:hypothetical protein ACVOMV_19780 [Mesorhizobium atlanticum]